MTLTLNNLDQKYGSYTFSQHGEDLYFMNLWRSLEIDKLSYLDLGAYHPTNISNTALLYQYGARGVNIEANSFLIDQFNKCRPEDINICVGVGLEPGIQKFYMQSEFSVLNSFKEKSFDQHNAKYNQIRLVPVITLSDIVKQYCNDKFPDFLFTDLEDLDYEVLESADFSQSKPKMICSEIRKDQSYDAKKMMSKKGYTYICKFSENHIFIEDSHVWMCV